MADRPTAEPLPIDRLRNLVDRACRHLTPQEANALRGALSGTVHNATTAVAGLHQRAADAEADLERARDVAVQLENENARLEDQQEGLLKATAKLINDVGYARHTLARDVLGWAEAREDMDLPQTVFYAVAEHRCDLARAERLEEQDERRTALGLRVEARAEGAEQQLATMTAVASGNKRHVQILTATLDAVTALHQPHGGHCGTCADENAEAAVWPCDTAAALDAPPAPAPEPAREDSHTGACADGSATDGETRTEPAHDAHTGVQPHDPEQLRADLARLHEGEEPHPDHTVIDTPGQWIWCWNRATLEQRLAGAAQVIRDAERAGRCFQEDHEKRLEETRVVRALPREQLHHAIRQLARVDRDWFHQQLRQMGRTDPAWLRDSFRTAARTEGARP